MALAESTDTLEKMLAPGSRLDLSDVKVTGNSSLPDIGNVNTPLPNPIQPKQENNEENKEEDEEDMEEEEEEEDDDDGFPNIILRESAEDTTQNSSFLTKGAINLQQKDTQQEPVQQNLNQYVPTPSQNKDSIYHTEYDSVNPEDRPWNKPGADITDYFNYGFNEDTWHAYCEKQRKERVEQSMQEKISVYDAGKEESPMILPPEFDRDSEHSNDRRSNNQGGRGRNTGISTGNSGGRDTGSNYGGNNNNSSSNTNNNRNQWNSDNRNTGRRNARESDDMIQLGDDQGDEYALTGDNQDSKNFQIYDSSSNRSPNDNYDNRGSRRRNNDRDADDRGSRDSYRDNNSNRGGRERDSRGNSDHRGSKRSEDREDRKRGGSGSSGSRGDDRSAGSKRSRDVNNNNDGNDRKRSKRV